MNALVFGSEENLVEQIKKIILTHYAKNAKGFKAIKSQFELSKYLKNRQKPELIIADTDLDDNAILDFLNEQGEGTPVIFFSRQKDKLFKLLKYNVIDYLLKPVKDEAIFRALNKYELINNSQLRETINDNCYKKRFIIKTGDKYYIKKIQEIAGFYTEDKLTYLISREKGRTFLIDNSLDDLEMDYLNPNQFFRISRQYIINIESIKEIKTYPNRRLKIELYTPIDSELVVSRDRVAEFKHWLNQ